MFFNISLRFRTQHRNVCEECQEEMIQCSTWTEYISTFLFVMATGIAGAFMVMGYYYRYAMGKGGLVKEPSVTEITDDYLIARHAIINTIAIMLVHCVCLLTNRTCCFCYKSCVTVTHILTAIMAFAMMGAGYFSAAAGVQLQKDRPGRTDGVNLRNVRGHSYLGFGVLVLYFIQCVTGFVQIVFKKEALSRIHTAMGVGIHVFILMAVVSALQTEQTRHARSETKYVPWTGEHLLHATGALATIISLIGVTLIMLRKELNANYVMVVGDTREY